MYIRNDLQYDLCKGCGEIKPMGLIPTIMHSCPLNTHRYRVRKFTMRTVVNIYYGIDPLKSFQELLHFESLKAMPGIDAASDLEKMFYSYQRDSDIQYMKRIRRHMEMEEEFDSKY